MDQYQSLIGRHWEYGVNDCFSLVKDFFALKGVNLPDFPRPDDYETADNLFIKSAESYGFKEVEYESRVPNDVLILKLGTATPMHIGVLIGCDSILHQKRKSISCVEPITRYYRKNTKAVFRYAAGFAVR